MSKHVKVGTEAELEFVVEAQHTIDFEFPNLPPVLSTPALIWFLEHAAIKVLTPVLEAGELSVGAKIELQHLAPTAIGGKVVCQARVIHVDHRLITFQVDARDQHDTIAKGLHHRQILSGDRLAAAVRRKMS